MELTADIEQSVRTIEYLDAQLTKAKQTILAFKNQLSQLRNLVAAYQNKLTFVQQANEQLRFEARRSNVQT